MTSWRNRHLASVVYLKTITPIQYKYFKGSDCFIFINNGTILAFNLPR